MQQFIFKLHVGDTFFVNAKTTVIWLFLILRTLNILGDVFNNFLPVNVNK
mgnify:FL=1